MLEGKIRATVELTYEIDGHKEARDLNVTFGLIDRMSGRVDWAAIPERLNDGGRPLADIAKLVFWSMVEAGFRFDDPEETIDEIYDALISNSEAEQSFTVVAMQIINAFMPKGKKKPKPKRTRKPKK